MYKHLEIIKYALEQKNCLAFAAFKSATTPSTLKRTSSAFASEHCSQI